MCSRGPAHIPGNCPPPSPLRKKLDSLHAGRTTLDNIRLADALLGLEPTAEQVENDLTDTAEERLFGRDSG
jgi:hypothetical protein